MLIEASASRGSGLLTIAAVRLSVSCGRARSWRRMRASRRWWSALAMKTMVVVGLHILKVVGCVGCVGWVVRGCGDFGGDGGGVWGMEGRGGGGGGVGTDESEGAIKGAKGGKAEKKTR